MAIKYDKAYNAEIRRIVHNFNQKRNRAIKRGFTHLPPLMTVRELKLRYTSRSQLNRELRMLERFNKDRDEALKVVETSGGAKAIKWELNYIKSNLRYAKEFYDREIEKAAALDTPLTVSKMEYLNNLKSKRDYLNLELAELSPSQLKTFRNTINDYLYANERDLQSYRSWMKEIEMIMRTLGYDNKTIDKFFEGFDQLSPQQFLTMYRQSSLVSRIYELYIPTKDNTFKLSTTEDDAKELINTFMLEKDELIENAKKQDFLDDKGLEEFVKSLNDKKLTQIKRERTKLKRKDLTPEQIKELQDLGWDDLIE